MLRRAREFGPAILVPLAWLFTVAVHADVVSDRTLFIAHLVMSVLLAVFAVTGRSDMQTGVLNVWWRIITVGFVVTVIGTVGFQFENGGEVLTGVALFGWMVLPAIGFFYTGERMSTGGEIYIAAGIGCLVGLLLYTAGLVLPAEAGILGGLVIVGIGQTAGIFDAVLQA